MAKPIWCEIVCNGCAKTIAGQFTYDKIPRKEMDKEAAKAGWIYTSYNFLTYENQTMRDWACPECRKNNPQIVR